VAFLDFDQECWLPATEPVRKPWLCSPGLAPVGGRQRAGKVLVQTEPRATL